VIKRGRTRKEQLADAAPSPRERARLFAAVLLFVFGIGVVFAAKAYLAAHPTMPPECAKLYREARTAADTARIDQLVFLKQASLACGVVRAALRRPA
jgi:hypothetical protein